MKHFLLHASMQARRRRLSPDHMISICIASLLEMNEGARLQ